MVLKVFIVLFGTIPARLAADEAAVSDFQSLDIFSNSTKDSVI